MIHNLKRIELIGTDIFCYYVKRQIEQWDDDTYNNFVEYHKQIRDNPYFIGATNHVLDIVKIIK